MVGDLVFVSGQTARDCDGVAAQTRAVLEKLGAVLKAAGSDYAKVVRCGVYLKDVGDFQEMNAVYREFFPKDPPARSTIGAPLAHPGRPGGDRLRRNGVVAVLHALPAWAE